MQTDNIVHTAIDICQNIVGDPFRLVDALWERGCRKYSANVAFISAGENDLDKTRQIGQFFRNGVQNLPALGLDPAFVQSVDNNDNRANKENCVKRFDDEPFKLLPQ